MNVIDLTIQGATILKVNGQTLGEFYPFANYTRDSLIEEVTQARAAQAACKWFGEVIKELDKAGKAQDHNFKTEKEKRANFAKGLESGLLGATIPHPEPGVPDTIPEASPSFCRGYELGSAIARACEIANGV